MRISELADDYTPSCSPGLESASNAQLNRLNVGASVKLRATMASAQPENVDAEDDGNSFLRSPPSTWKAHTPRRHSTWQQRWPGLRNADAPLSDASPSPGAYRPTVTKPPLTAATPRLKPAPIDGAPPSRRRRDDLPAPVVAGLPAATMPAAATPTTHLAPVPPITPAALTQLPRFPPIRQADAPFGRPLRGHVRTASLSPEERQALLTVAAQVIAASPHMPLAPST